MNSFKQKLGSTSSPKNVNDKDIKNVNTVIGSSENLKGKNGCSRRQTLCLECIICTPFVVSDKPNVHTKRFCSVQIGKEIDSRLEDDDDFSAELHYVTGTIMNKSKQKLSLHLDSGAEVNVIDELVAKVLPYEVKRLKVDLESATGDRLNCQGLMRIPLQLGKLTVNIPFLVVVNPPFTALLSVHFLQRFGVRTDYARQVLDFWQNGMYSGPVKMVRDTQDPESEVDVKREEGMRGGKVRKVCAFRVASGWESIKEATAMKRCNHGVGSAVINQVIDAEDLIVKLYSNCHKAKIEMKNKVTIPVYGSIHLDTQLLYNETNPVHKIYVNLHYELNISIHESSNQGSLILQVTNLSDRPAR